MQSAHAGDGRLLCVSFRVGSDGHVIQAHRYVLVSRSCVFHAMFCGQMAEQGEITIPDIEPDVFKDFLRFLYTDNVDLTVKNVTGLIYTSRKYDVDALFHQCVPFLHSSMTEANVCEILETCHSYGVTDIEEEALRRLKRAGEITLKSSGFKKLCPSCFETFITSENLDVKEEDIFEAALTWAKERCEEEDLEPSPENQRKILGNLIHQIRFSAFSLDYLITTVRRSQILKPEERMLLVDNVGNQDIDIAPFVAKKRKLTYNVVKRFRTDWSGIGGKTCKGKFDTISFSASRDITLAGIQLYGPVRFPSSEYKIGIRIIYYDRDISNWRSFRNRGITVHEPYKSADITLKGQREINDVMFPQPIKISIYGDCDVVVTLKGEHTNGGSDGIQFPEADGVTFTFMESSLTPTDSRTTVSKGQIPGLIWLHG